MSEYNLNDYSGDNAEEVKSFDNDTGKFSMSGNGVIRTIWEAAKAAARYQVVRMVLFAIVTVLVFAFTGDFSKSKNVADEMATKGANDDFLGTFSVFAKETGHRSVKLNMHPFYHTKGVRRLEQKFELQFGYSISFSKLFAFVRYDDQDFMVMKKAAKGKDREKIKLELSTLFPGTSADDYCEDYFDGFIIDEELRKIFVKSWKVSKIKDELTKDNDSGAKLFRCAIDSDVIEDYLEVENDR